MTAILLFSINSWAADSAKLTLELTKCVSNQADFKESKDLKVFAAQKMQIECTRQMDGGKQDCTLSEQKDSAWSVLTSREFTPELRVGSVAQMVSDDNLLRIYVNQELKTAAYFAQEFPSQTKIKILTCTGQIVENKEPKKSEAKPAPKKPDNKAEMPSMIGY